MAKLSDEEIKKIVENAVKAGLGDIASDLVKAAKDGYEATSGLMLTENPDGSIRLEFSDYGVGRFGGGDYECWYDFDVENATKLRNELGKLQKGTLTEQAIAQFGKNFDAPQLWNFCKEHDIKYTSDSWTSYGDDDDDF